MNSFKKEKIFFSNIKKRLKALKIRSNKMKTYGFVFWVEFCKPFYFSTVLYNTGTHGHSRASRTESYYTLTDGRHCATALQSHRTGGDGVLCP